MSLTTRSAWQITWSVWRALFIRDAMYRLFSRRAAWVWVLLEPAIHVAFFVFLFTMVNIRTIGGIDAAVWVMVGFQGYFMFRRTLSLSMAGVHMSRVLFTYRQVKPVDTVIVRGLTEGLLMLVIIVLMLMLAAMLDIPVFPSQPLQVILALFALWYMGLGLGLILSIPRVLLHETENLVNLVLTPLYFISGILVSVNAVPMPYRRILIANPVSHAIDALRVGFSDTYQPFHEMNLAYCYLMGSCWVCLGLMLHRVYRNRMLAL